MNRDNIVKEPYRYAGREETEYLESIEGDECPECSGFLQGEGTAKLAHEVDAGEGKGDEPAYIAYGCEGCGRSFLQKFEPVGAANLTEIEAEADE